MDEEIMMVEEEQPIEEADMEEEIVEEVEEAEEEVSEEEPAKKRGGSRKPRTPEQKASAAKARAERKQLAANMKPQVFVQFQETEANINDLVESAKAAFRAEKKRTRITDMKLYVKPDERAAYYVINGKHEGKVSY